MNADATKREKEKAESTATALYTVGAVGLAFTVAAFAFFGARAGVSTAVGAVLATSNLWVLGKIIRAVLSGGEAIDAESAKSAESAKNDATAGAERDASPAVAARDDDPGRQRRRAGAWSLFALLKILVLFGGVLLLMTLGLVDPIPLVVGYGALPIGITLSTMFAQLKP